MSETKLKQLAKRVLGGDLGAAEELARMIVYPDLHELARSAVIARHGGEHWAASERDIEQRIAYWSIETRGRPNTVPLADFARIFALGRLGERGYPYRSTDARNELCRCLPPDD